MSCIEQLDGPITRVIVTHMHPDHIGCAGYLTETYQVDLYMSQTEYYAARALIAGNLGADNWQERRYYRAAGFTPEHISLYSVELDMCIGGDQVLPKITPNIGAYSTQPQFNPLQACLTPQTIIDLLPIMFHRELNYSKSTPSVILSTCR